MYNNNRPYYNRGYNRNYGQNYGGGYQSQPRKKSGAKLTQGKNDKPVISAWKKNRYAFLSMVATPNNGENIAAKGGRVIKNKKGQEYARWTVTITERNTGQVSTHSGLYNLATGKLYIPDLKLVANPKAPNGGYFGNSFVRNRR